MNYCPKCGRKIEYKDIPLEGNIPYCPTCCAVYFPHAMPCVIALIEYEGKLLLIRQSYVTRGFCLVAGHVKEASTLEETVKEEISEEVGLATDEMTYVSSYYYPKHSNLMLGFYVKAHGTIKINEEVDSYQLVTKEEALTLLDGSLTAIRLLKDAIVKGLVS